MFEPRIHENGNICCSSELALCDKCKEHFGQRTADDEYDSPPNPYAPDLATLRAASATPAPSTFEEQYKAQRLRDLTVEQRALDAHIEATPQPRMTVAEAAAYEAPNSYDAGIKALQTADAARLAAREQRR